MSKLAKGAPVTALIDGVWKYTQIVSVDDEIIVVVDKLPDQIWTHLRSSEGTSWNYGHASYEELAALVVAHALATQRP